MHTSHRLLCTDCYNSDVADDLAQISSRCVARKQDLGTDIKGQDHIILFKYNGGLRYDSGKQNVESGLKL